MAYHYAPLADPYAWYQVYNPQAWWNQAVPVYQAPPPPLYQAPPPPHQAPPPPPHQAPPPYQPEEEEEDDDDAMDICSESEEEEDNDALVPAPPAPLVDPRPTREAGFMLKQKMPAPPLARPQRIKGRKVRVHRVGDNHFLPPLEFKSMAACLRHFGLWPKKADGTLKKTINTTRTFEKWIKESCGGIVAEVGDPYGGPFMEPQAPVLPQPAIPPPPQAPMLLPQPAIPPPPQAPVAAAPLVG